MSVSCKDLFSEKGDVYDISEARAAKMINCLKKKPREDYRGDYKKATDFKIKSPYGVIEVFLLDSDGDLVAENIWWMRRSDTVWWVVRGDES